MSCLHVLFIKLPLFEIITDPLAYIRNNADTPIYTTVFPKWTFWKTKTISQVDNDIDIGTIKNSSTTKHLPLPLKKMFLSNVWVTWWCEAVLQLK